MITQRARAKLNLTLRILGRRPDGYHEVDSLIAFADDIYDIVTLDPSKPTRVTLSGPFAGAIVGPNLVETALHRLTAAEPGLKVGAVHIEKHLPVAAGIGGGSADAAAVLRAVRTANPSFADAVDWMEIAAGLGADVPVCFLDRTCHVTGFGERLVELPRLPALPAVLANPLADVPSDKTAQVFGRLAAPPLMVGVPPSSIAPFAGRQDLIDFMSKHGNDLETAACQVLRIVSDVLEALKGTPGCLCAGVSGAGPTCLGIFEDKDAAATAISKQHSAWWVRPTMIGAG